tara:strand:- start:1378 stop:1839 length:462 start_codon:yes stop_codon:yes gene_type:complete
MHIPKLEYKAILANIPIVCVDLIIINDGKFLLLKRDNEPAKGEFWFPGGRILKLETIKGAALRKAKLEVNLDCAFHDIISVEETIFDKKIEMSTTVHTINIVCKLTTDNIKELKLDNLHSNFIWTPLNQFNDLKLHKALLKPLSKLTINNSYK